MKRAAYLSAFVVTGLLSISLLSSSFRTKSQADLNTRDDDEISYKANGKQSRQEGHLQLSTAFENDYYTRNNRTGHYYAEVHADNYQNNETKHLPLNISVVIDRSGSMSGDKIRNAKQAAKFIVDQLNPDDYFSVVMYDQTVDVVHEASRVENKQAIKLKIDRIVDRGSTNLMGGAMKGYEQVRKNYRSGYINRVLLLSDGLANEGITDAKQIERIVRKKSMDEGISISTFGVGNDYNEDLMTAMAESGTGNYYFISNAENIANIFKKELNGLKDIVAQDAELVVRIPDYVNIDKVYGCKYIQDGRTLRIKFRDVFASETKGVLIKYTVDANRNTTIRFDASLSFTDALTAETRRIALNNKNDYTDNRSLFQESYSEWVSAQVALYESNERLEMAMQEVDKGNYDEAKKIVKQNKEYMKSKAPLVNKSVELQKAESVNSTYDMQIKDVENMPQEDVKYMQKASKSSNYEIRTKK